MSAGEGVDASPNILVSQVLDRLRKKIPVFNKANCLPTDSPIPPDSYFPQGKLTCTVCLLDGKFDRPLFIGGAGNQLTEYSDLVVTVLTRNKLDQPPRAEAALFNAEFGILSVHKPRLLQALIVDDPTQEILQQWIPVTESGAPFLRDGGLVPTHCRGPAQLDRSDWLGLELHFSVCFDWDLRFQT
jgi:hypothetical protein